ncbi:MAG: hypothetical protein ACJ8DL_14695, partial [Microvirga sp.]
GGGPPGIERVADEELKLRQPQGPGPDGSCGWFAVPDFEPALYARPPSALGASRPESVLPHKGGGVVRAV